MRAKLTFLFLLLVCFTSINYSFCNEGEAVYLVFRDDKKNKQTGVYEKIIYTAVGTQNYDFYDKSFEHSSGKFYMKYTNPRNIHTVIVYEKEKATIKYEVPYKFNHAPETPAERQASFENLINTINDFEVKADIYFNGYKGTLNVTKGGDTEVDRDFYADFVNLGGQLVFYVPNKETIGRATFKVENVTVTNYGPVTN